MITETTMESPASVSVMGYSHPAYAASLSEFGSPLELKRSRGWLLRRHIPKTELNDAMGGYPIFACTEWAGLECDLKHLRDELVSIGLVTDPFGDYDLRYLKKCFPDLVVPFKQHYVVDLRQDPSAFISSHHQRNLRKALVNLTVENCANPPDWIDDWVTLYGHLIARHQVTGIARFSRTSFLKQLQVPGIVMFRAVRNNQTVGMLLWFVQRGIAYYHLGAYTAAGYDGGASFALFKYAIDYFARQGLSWLSLGAGAGSKASDSGLNRFKAGWATGQRTAYFCGRIFDRKAYDEIVRLMKVPAATSYFPAYRSGEFR